MMSDKDVGQAFNHDQFSDWRTYERVRARGRFNMFDPRARRETGLSAKRYSFVMQNYSQLLDAMLKERARMSKDTG